MSISRSGSTSSNNLGYPISPTITTGSTATANVLIRNGIQSATLLTTSVGSGKTYYYPPGYSPCCYYVGKLSLVYGCMRSNQTESEKNEERVSLEELIQGIRARTKKTIRGVIKNSTFIRKHMCIRSCSLLSMYGFNTNDQLVENIREVMQDILNISIKPSSESLLHINSECPLIRLLASIRLESGA